MSTRTPARVRVITGHPAAGADTQAHNRPIAVRAPLQTSHDKTIDVMADLARGAVLCGESAVIATDGNTRRLLEQLRRLLPAQHIYSGLDHADMPDYVLFIAGPGCTDVHVHHETFRNPVEPGLHDGHRVTWTWLDADADGNRHQITVVYVNTGRASEAKVHELWFKDVHEAFQGADVLVAVEVDEGDHGYSDHAIIRRAIRRVRRLVYKGSREIIVLARDSAWEAAGAPIVRRAGRSVARWSPSRPATGQDLVEKGAA